GNRSVRRIDRVGRRRRPDILPDLSRHGNRGRTKAARWSDVHRPRHRVDLIGMLAAKRSDYVRRAGQGQFSSSGSSFQYLRMFKAIMLILDAARTEVREAADA